MVNRAVDKKGEDKYEHITPTVARAEPPTGKLPTAPPPPYNSIINEEYTHIFGFNNDHV